MERKILKLGWMPQCKNSTVSDRCAAKVVLCPSHLSCQRRTMDNRYNTKRASKAWAARWKYARLRRLSLPISFTSRKFHLLHRLANNQNKKSGKISRELKVWLPRLLPSANFRTREAFRRATMVTCSSKSQFHHLMWLVAPKRMTWWGQVKANRRSRPHLFPTL